MGSCPSETKPCWAPATYHNYEMYAQYVFPGPFGTSLLEGDFFSIDYMSLGTYDNHVQVRVWTGEKVVLGLTLKSDEDTYTLLSESGKTTTSVPVRHGDGQGITFRVVQRADGYFDAYIDDDLVLTDQFLGGLGGMRQIRIFQDGGAGKWWNQVGGAVFNNLLVNIGSDCPIACFDGG